MSRNRGLFGTKSTSSYDSVVRLRATWIGKARPLWLESLTNRVMKEQIPSVLRAARGFRVGHGRAAWRRSTRVFEELEQAAFAFWAQRQHTSSLGHVGIRGIFADEDDIVGSDAIRSEEHTSELQSREN